MRSLTCLLLVAAHASAQETPVQVTEQQVASYQVGLEAGCKRVAKNRGESAEKAEGYCTCVIKALRENATQLQWQQATFAFLKGQSREEMQALSEHTLKFQACKSGAP